MNPATSGNMSTAEESDPIAGAERDKTIKTLSNTLTNLYDSDLKDLNGKLKDFT